MERPVLAGVYDRHMWRFIHLTDVHLGSLIDGEWNNRFVCTMMPEVISCLRRDLAKLQPDFLLVTGDIVSQKSRDAAFASRDLLDSLHIPYYPTGGNHDFVSEHTRSLFLEVFGAHLPEGDTVYSFTHKGLHFCVLDPWWKWSDGTLCACSEASVADDDSGASRVSFSVTCTYGANPYLNSQNPYQQIIAPSPSPNAAAESAAPSDNAGGNS